MLGDDAADIARFDGLVDFTRYAVRLRYAGADPGTRPLDRPEAIEQVEVLLATVQSRLAETKAG